MDRHNLPANLKISNTWLELWAKKWDMDKKYFESRNVPFVVGEPVWYREVGPPGIDFRRIEYLPAKVIKKKRRNRYTIVFHLGSAKVVKTVSFREIYHLNEVAESLL